MTAAERLTALKQNLQLLTDAHDTYLALMLNQAEAEIMIMGIEPDGSVLYDTVIIDYAAYKWRSRARDTSKGKDGATAMPRFLKRNINNLLFSQRIREAMI